MFALGLQESCQAVALLLGATDGEKFMKVVIVAVLRPPGLGKVPDHRAHLRLHGSGIGHVHRHRQHLALAGGGGFLEVGRLMLGAL